VVAEPALAVGLGGIAGVLGGLLFFRGVRRFAARSVAAGRGKGALVAGLAWRLAAVVGLAATAGYFGGPPGALAVLVGLVLARLTIRRRPA
jgi:hypothetical protein